MDGLETAEFEALRSAIAARGSLKAALTLAGLAAWALTLVVVLAWLPYPLASIVPLLVLVATFEVIRPLHLGAERIGRYLQVFYEEGGPAPRPMAATPSWERVAMVFGGAMPGAGGHPLFVPIFALATLVNSLALVLPGPLPLEIGTLAVPHLAFVAWLVVADRAMRQQRARELARFRELRNSGDAGGLRS